MRWRWLRKTSGVTTSRLVLSVVEQLRRSVPAFRSLFRVSPSFPSMAPLPSVIAVPCQGQQHCTAVPKPMWGKTSSPPPPPPLLPLPRLTGGQSDNATSNLGAPWARWQSVTSLALQLASFVGHSDCMLCVLVQVTLTTLIFNHPLNASLMLSPQPRRCPASRQRTLRKWRCAPRHQGDAPSPCPLGGDQPATFHAPTAPSCPRSPDTGTLAP